MGNGKEGGMAMFKIKTQNFFLKWFIYCYIIDLNFINMFIIKIELLQKCIFCEPVYEILLCITTFYERHSVFFLVANK